MSLEAFVRASGDAMGFARDLFGVNVSPGAGVRPSAPLPPLAATVSGSGQAVSAATNQATVLAEHASTLSEHDLALHSHLEGILAAGGAGLQQMEAVIEGALGDIIGLAPTTTCPAGQQALMGALTNRLEQTRQALKSGNTCACTCAASSAQVAAGFNGLGNSSVGGMSPATVMAPMAAMSTMPMLAAGQMAAANQAASSSQSSAQQQQQLPFSDGVNPTHAPATTRPGARQRPIPVSAILYHGAGFHGGKVACEQYIRQTLNLMGISNLRARNNWFHGLLVGIYRESGYHPSSANGWDSNAVGALREDGFPANSSRGLMQTIPSTFAAHHSGYSLRPGDGNNIYDPIANISAGMNYLMSRYHVARDGSNLGAVSQFNPNSAGGGY